MNEKEKMINLNAHNFTKYNSSKLDLPFLIGRHLHLCRRFPFWMRSVFYPWVFQKRIQFRENSLLSFKQNMLSDRPISILLLCGIALDDGLWGWILGGWRKSESLMSWEIIGGPGWKLWYWLTVCFNVAWCNSDGIQRGVFLPSASRYEFRPFCPNLTGILEFFSHCKSIHLWWMMDCIY